MRAEPRRWQRRWTPGLGLALLLLVGCSSRRQAGAGEAGEAPGPSRARQVLEAIREAYELQDMEAILGHVAHRFYPDVSRLRRALYEDRERFATFRLDFHVNQEIASDDQVLLKVQWNREQTSMQTGVPAVARGVAEFQFRREDGKLLDLRPVRGGMPIGFN